MRYVQHLAPNGNGGAFNPALAGLREKLNGSRAPQKPALPSMRKRSKARGLRVRALAAAIGRSREHYRQLLRVLELGSPELVRQVITEEITVFRALEALDPEVAHDRKLTERFAALPRSTREMLLSLTD
jgi:hypothetical protein